MEFPGLWNNTCETFTFKSLGQFFCAFNYLQQNVYQYEKQKRSYKKKSLFLHPYLSYVFFCSLAHISTPILADIPKQLKHTTFFHISIPLHTISTLPEKYFLFLLISYKF